MDSVSRGFNHERQEQQHMNEVEQRHGDILCPDETDNSSVADAMKEAYRNVAANLAASAWGDDDGRHRNSPGSFRNIGSLIQYDTRPQTSKSYHSISAFDLVIPNSKREIISPDNSDVREQDKESRVQSKKGFSSPVRDESFKRSPKVAKASYADHGSHAEQYSPPSKTNDRHHKDNILKNLVYSIKQTYDNINKKTLHEFDNSTPNPAYFNNSDGTQLATTTQQAEETITHSQANASSQASSGLKALLNSYSANTNATSTSSTSNSNSNSEEGIQSRFPRGKCLSSPSKPTSNNGLDNSEGNLIVHVNDIITIPKHLIHYQSTKMKSQINNLNNKEIHQSSNNNIQFLIVELLGQGTFAQVFKCKNLLTNEMMAIKIVKSKEAYTRQAAIEIEIFKSLASDLPVNYIREQQQQRQNQEKLGGRQRIDKNSATNDIESNANDMVELLCYFLYHSHLCLVFELLGMNLYEVLKRRQFRGLSIRVVQSLVKQAMTGVKKLSQHRIVHCDLKPENILLVDNEVISSLSNVNESPNSEEDEQLLGSSHKQNTQKSNTRGFSREQQKIKLIDFGSACFEGQTAHTYIQSRFYRSPEVLVGLPYDSAIDMWSLGCVAAELFLGLPILPGVHEHDQLCRICEMISPIPDWMLDQGSKSEKYFMKIQQSSTQTKGTNIKHEHQPNPKTVRSNWRLKTRQEHVLSLSAKEKGNHEKLDQQPNRYFKRKRLSDIVSLHGHHCQNADKEILRLFIHFLKGVLEPDPWKRWTAHQASVHPFVTGIIPDSFRRSKEFKWVPPWDPSICDRKLLSIKKEREKKANLRRANLSNYSALASNNKSKQILNTHSIDAPPLPQVVHNGDRIHSVAGYEVSPDSNTTSRVTAMAQSMSLLSTQGMSLPVGHTNFWGMQNSPPPLVGLPNMPAVLHHPYNPRIDDSINYSLQPHMQNNSNNSFHHQETRPYIQSQDYNSNASSFSNIAPLGSSMIETQYPSAMMIPSAMSNIRGGYGDYSYQVHCVPSIAGPQSFSGVYYDRISQHLPIEGDLGHALQRPGVVPSIDNEQAGSLTQQHGMAFMAQRHLVSNENLLSPRSRNTSFSSVASSNMSMVQNTHINSNVNASHSSGQQSRGHPQDRKETSMDLPSYPLEHDENNSLGYGIKTNSSVPRSENRGMGLLAQQLAEHSASLREPNETINDHNSRHSNIQNNLQSSYPNQNHHLAQTVYQHPGQVNENLPGSYGSLQQMHGSYYSYAPSNGPPLILSSTAPSGADPRMAPYYANSGQYPSIHGSLHSTIPPGNILEMGGHPIPIHSQVHAHGIDPNFPVVDESEVGLDQYHNAIRYAENYMHMQPPSTFYDDRGSV